MAKVPPRGFTGRCMQLQERMSSPGAPWVNSCGPKSVSEAEATYALHPEWFGGQTPSRRFCYLVPVDITTKIEFTLNEEYK